MSDGRDEHGRFADGNPGGPGRPRRAIEREYLAALGDAVTLDDWRDVVARAMADAKAGDRAARTWLGRYLVGDKPPTLLQLASKEACGITAEADVADQQREVEREARFRELLGGLQ